MNAPQCTPRIPIVQPAAATGLGLFELRVTFDKFLRTTSWEAHGDAAVFVVALDANDCSDAETGVTNLASQHGIGVAAALCSATPEGTLSRLAARGRFCLLWTAADSAQELFGGIGILGVRLVAALLPDFRHRSANGFHQFAGNLGKEARRQGSAQLLFIAEDTAVDGTRQCERLPRTGHSNVKEAPLLFDSFFFGDGAAMGTDAFFPAPVEHVIEFQALGAVQRGENDSAVTFAC